MDGIRFVKKTPIGLFDGEVWVTQTAGGPYDAVVLDWEIWQAIEKIVDAYWDGGEDTPQGDQTIEAVDALVKLLNSEQGDNADRMPWRYE